MVQASSDNADRDRPKGHVIHQFRVTATFCVTLGRPVDGDKHADNDDQSVGA
ncbi:Uncharacterised protein [Chlamydia trachomatis]|nr:Uncharacterised protein [Chlamydia trachomatis]